MRRRWVELEQLLDRVNRLSSPTVSADPNRQAEPAVLVDHIEEFGRSPIHGLVELEDDRPDVMGVFSTQQLPFASKRQ
jgi:hypothetical protein